MMFAPMRFKDARAIEQALRSVTPDATPYAFTSEASNSRTAFKAGDHISFTTKGGTRVQGGLVLEVDLCAVLPVRVEYHVPGYGKRIERFHPDEFINFQKEFRQ